MTLSVSGDSITFPDLSTLQTAPSGFGFKNRIINGDMRIDQRNAGASFSPGPSGAIDYSVDRFGGARPGTGVAFTLQRVTDAPAGFINSLKVTVPTGATPSGTQLSFVQQPIEGSNISDLGWGGSNAQTVTLSFWVKSSLTGSFPLVLVNSGTVRAYGATYTINSANTWEYKILTIAGDITGNWLTTDGLGIGINWGLGGAGASRTVTTGWQNTPSPGSSVGVIAGTVNLVGTSGATFYVTGVQLEKGSTATAFDYRDYGRELIMCQRYLPAFRSSGGSNDFFAAGMAISSTVVLIAITYPAQARVKPTGLIISNPANFLGLTAVGTAATITAISLNSSTVNGGLVSIATSGVSAGNGTLLGFNGSSTTADYIYFTGCEL